MKLLSIVGARPQFVKAAALARAIDAIRQETGECAIAETLVHTGQHYDFEMSRAFFEQLPLPSPAYNLGIGSGGHGAQTGRMLERLEDVMLAEKPDIVLVYGDTNSTLAGALSAAKLHIPVAHVEAGLRSFNRRMPEETNRVLTDHVSRWLFCPTETAVVNLGREGIDNGVELVGDVMYDMLRHYAASAASPPILSELALAPGSYALATVHRADTTDNPQTLRSVTNALSAVSQRLPIVLPVHPRTRLALGTAGISFSSRVHLVSPLNYIQMLAAERDARLVLTDSGGVQKEAYWLGIPCVTLRRETEWLETLDEGRNVLAGTAEDAIVGACDALLAKPRFGAPHVELAGAAVRIVRLLEQAES